MTLKPWPAGLFWAAWEPERLGVLGVVSPWGQPRNRGESKISEFHPGWFYAPTEPLGFRTKSTGNPEFIYYIVSY